MTYFRVLMSSIIAFLSIKNTVYGHDRLIKVAGTLEDKLYTTGFGIHPSRFSMSKEKPSDAGGDATLFSKKIQYVKNPDPPCGINDEVGIIDAENWISMAQGFGLPSTTQEGYLSFSIFQVNRDGGGGFQIEINTNAKLDSWIPVKTVINSPGLNGNWPVNRINQTIVAHIPPNLKCTGGWTGNTCVARARGGWLKRFGGCAAFKMANAQPTRAVKVIPFKSMKKKRHQITEMHTHLFKRTMLISSDYLSLDNDTSKTITDHELIELSEGVFQVMIANAHLAHPDGELAVTSAPKGTIVTQSTRNTIGLSDELFRLHRKELVERIIKIAKHENTVVSAESAAVGTFIDYKISGGIPDMS